MFTNPPGTGDEHGRCMIAMTDWPLLAKTRQSIPPRGVAGPGSGAVTAQIGPGMVEWLRFLVSRSFFKPGPAECPPAVLGAPNRSARVCHIYRAG
jgi:hypothetical protein